jgi:hypothetical protein
MLVNLAGVTCECAEDGKVIETEEPLAWGKTEGTDKKRVNRDMTSPVHSFFVSGCFANTKELEDVYRIGV